MSLANVIVIACLVMIFATLLHAVWAFGIRPLVVHRRERLDRERIIEELEKPLIRSKRLPTGQIIDTELDPHSLEGLEMRLERASELAQGRLSHASQLQLTTEVGMISHEFNRWQRP